MYLVAIAWMYVVLMMALSEAISPQGTVLGAVFTFLLYGLGPMALVLYIIGTPGRRKLRRQAEAQEDAARAAAAAAAAAEPDAAAVAAAVASSGLAPDGSGQAAGHAVTAERKEA